MARVIHLIRMCPLSSATFHMSEGRWARPAPTTSTAPTASRSEEHTSELQSLTNLVCRLLLEKKNRNANQLRQSTVLHEHTLQRSAISPPHRIPVEKITQAQSETQHHQVERMHRDYKALPTLS